MAELTIDYPDELLAGSGKSRATLERELRVQLAVRLFEVGEVSLGRAAQMAGMAKGCFREELSRMGIPVINLDDEEIHAEIRASRGDYRRG